MLKPEGNNKSLVTGAEGFIEGPSPWWLAVVFAGAEGFFKGPPPWSPSAAFFAAGFRTTERRQVIISKLQVEMERQNNLESERTFLYFVKDPNEGLLEFVHKIFFIEELFSIITLPPVFEGWWTEKVKLIVEQWEYCSTRIPANMLGGSVLSIVIAKI